MAEVASISNKLKEEQSQELNKLNKKMKLKKKNHE